MTATPKPVCVFCICAKLAVLFAAAAVCLLSCGNADRGPISPNGENVLHIDVPVPIRSLDPREETGAATVGIFMLIYSRLFTVGGDGRIEPDLAIKWTYDPGKLAWTIRLREDAFFHDGKRVTSRDVIYSLECLSKRQFGLYDPEIAAIIPDSETSLTLILKWDDPDFLRKIGRIDILPAGGMEWIDSNRHPVGSGPFHFSYKRGNSEVGLAANKDYYFGKPSLDGIVYHYIEDRERSWARLLSGKTDVATEIYPKDYEMIKHYRDRFHFSERIVQSYSLLLYNTGDPLFHDPEVRRALSLAVDRDYIVEKLLRGLGVPARGPLGVNSPYADADASPLPYDPGKSRELLLKAGWRMDEKNHCLSKEGRCFEFILSIFEGFQVDRKIAEYLQLCFNGLGIRAYIEALPHRELVRRYANNNEYQAVLTEFKGAYGDPEIVAEIWTPVGARSSRAGCFDDLRTTELLHDAFRESDPRRRGELLRAADARIVSLQPAIFLFHKIAFDILSGRISVERPFSFTLSQIHQLKDMQLTSK